MKFYVVSLIVAAGATFALAEPARADQSAGTLVYKFTYSANQAIQARDTGGQGYGAPDVGGSHDPGTGLPPQCKATESVTTAAR